jgi:GNAT acetyltransferase-like protein
LFVPELVARLGQALGLHVPRLLWSRLGRDEDRLLGARCRLWRSEGYIRSALRLLAPRLFAQPRFFSQLAFRRRVGARLWAAGLGLQPSAGGARAFSGASPGTGRVALHGPLRFEAHTTDPRALAALVEWKAGQYRRTKATNVFAFGWTLKLLERILGHSGEEFSGMLSAL